MDIIIEFIFGFICYQIGIFFINLITLGKFKAKKYKSATSMSLISILGAIIIILFFILIFRLIK